VRADSCGLGQKVTTKLLDGLQVVEKPIGAEQAQVAASSHPVGLQPRYQLIDGERYDRQIEEAVVYKCVTG
jgi:hypothetical protein